MGKDNVANMVAYPYYDVLLDKYTQYKSFMKQIHACVNANEALQEQINANYATHLRGVMTKGDVMHVVRLVSNLFDTHRHNQVYVVILSYVTAHILITDNKIQTNGAAKCWAVAFTASYLSKINDTFKKVF
ncbi:hypothetical protein RFI_04858 [Reticulomyxa filosa]|uniref:Uncharacterized protein n=1 Tax=Reticulomyxa filosa TaxID=46433 RepID=X6P2F2_RETFI|nr:hypothetical protein RFI_04858 [Reticulomyxa filosa]|eukprot:ETO32259.1 hypothetical protein RFI_04858 [Reticulomyxa filosa]